MYSNHNMYNEKEILEVIPRHLTQSKELHILLRKCFRNRNDMSYI
jgi:hypothetical protein